MTIQGAREASADPTVRQIERQRWTLLHRLEATLEIPMLVLGLAWLALLVVELGWGLNRPLELFGLAIWVVFIADFVIKFVLAPEKKKFLRSNWLVALAVTFAGAAGMYAFEGPSGPGGLPDYGHALWWTAMMMTTMGPEYWPVTTEGRILCLLLALYAFTVFGYVTAILATYFIDRDAEDHVGVAGASELRALRREIQEMRDEVRRGR